MLITLPAFIGVAASRAVRRLGRRSSRSLFAAFLVGESVADQQQWNFHQRKKPRRAGSARARLPDDRAVRATAATRTSSSSRRSGGSSSRFGAIAAGSAAAAGPSLGAALLTLLFIGSTVFTESITKSKYPEYADYQATTSAVIPWPPKRDRPAQRAA